MKKLVFIFITLLFFSVDKVRSGSLFSTLIGERTFTKYRLYFIFTDHRDDFFSKINMPSTFTNPIKDTKPNGWHNSLPLFYIQWNIPSLNQDQIDEALSQAAVVRQMVANDIRTPQWIEAIR